MKAKKEHRAKKEKGDSTCCDGQLFEGQRKKPLAGGGRGGGVRRDAEKTRPEIWKRSGGETRNRRREPRTGGTISCNWLESR